MERTAATSTPYSADYVAHARSTAASESTSVPSMSKSTARMSLSSITPPLNSLSEHKVERCHDNSGSPRSVADGCRRTGAGEPSARHHPRGGGAGAAAEYQFGH